MSGTRLRLSALASALLAAALLAGCGGGGSDAEPAARATPAPLQASTVVLTADVDLDGLNDILEIPLDTPGAEGEPRCWRGHANGTFTPTRDWGEHPGVDAIRDDLQRRPNHDILGDEGAHQAPLAADTIPYAVLHLGPAAGEGDAPGDPIIDALHPLRGRSGSLVGIRGEDLAARGETTTVRFDDLEARVLLALPQFVLTIVPDQAPLGVIDVVVTRGSLESSPAAFTVVERPTPVVDSVQPDPLVPGVLAVLRGRDLGSPANDVRVTFGGVAAERVLALGTLVFAEVPAAAASGLVIVTVDGVASVGIQAEVAIEFDAPTLTRVSPAAASAGSLVRIEGDDLFVIGQAPRVRFGTQRALLFGIERGAVIAIVPTRADGAISISVGGRNSEPLDFELLERREPTITSIEPAGAKRGAAIDILGSDLHDMTGIGPGSAPISLDQRLPRVLIGGKRAWFVLPIVGGLRCIVPFTAPIGAGEVTVTLGGDASAPAPFTVK